MAIQCPNCWTENPDDAKFCQMCATALPGVWPGAPITAVNLGSAAHGPSSKKIPGWAIFVILIGIGVVVASAVVGTGLLSAMTLGSDLRAELTYVVNQDSVGHIRPGEVYVSGTIRNYGEANVSGTVHLHITYSGGTSMGHYDVATGIVLVGESVHFGYGVILSDNWLTGVSVHYSVTTD